MAVYQPAGRGFFDDQRKKRTPEWFDVEQRQTVFERVAVQ